MYLRSDSAAGVWSVRQSAWHAELLLHERAPRSDVEIRDTQYWQLMRSGMTNTAACKILGVTDAPVVKSGLVTVSRPCPLGAQCHPRDGICRCGNDYRLPICCGWAARCAPCPPAGSQPVDDQT
jgi:hypothetical protein